MSYSNRISIVVIMVSILSLCFSVCDYYFSHNNSCFIAMFMAVFLGATGGLRSKIHPIFKALPIEICFFYTMILITIQVFSGKYIAFGNLCVHIIKLTILLFMAINAHGIISKDTKRTPDDYWKNVRLLALLLSFVEMCFMIAVMATAGTKGIDLNVESLVFSVSSNMLFYAGIMINTVPGR